MSQFQVLAQLRGQKELPWAEGCISPDARARMGAMYAPLMKLLNRDPTQRPSAAYFRDQCMAISASSTTVLVNEIRIAGAGHISDDRVEEADSLDM